MRNQVRRGPDDGYHAGMKHEDYLMLDDAALLTQCEVHVHRSSGPGGQRRNKVATAVRLVHTPTGVEAQAAESRYQPENKRRALQRLRMKIACEHRRPVEADRLEAPAAVGEFLRAGRGAGEPGRLSVGRRERRFWPVAAFLLDLLEACDGKLSKAAACVGISTANYTHVLTEDKHLLAAAQGIRRRHGHRPIR